MDIRLKKILKIIGISQKKFAQDIGIHLNTISRYIRGLQVPDSHVLTKIVQVYKININWLLTGEGDMFIREVSLDEIKNIVNLYEIADERDRKIVNTVLEKYKKEPDIKLSKVAEEKSDYETNNKNNTD
jgi:transcriptional regulator with XRE-family HTH domain